VGPRTYYSAPYLFSFLMGSWFFLSCSRLLARDSRRRRRRRRRRRLLLLGEGVLTKPTRTPNICPGDKVKHLRPDVLALVDLWISLATRLAGLAPFETVSSPPSF